LKYLQDRVRSERSGDNLPGFSLVDGYIQQNLSDAGLLHDLEKRNLDPAHLVLDGSAVQEDKRKEGSGAKHKSSDNGGRNQLWRIQDAGNGLKKIIPALSPGFALDVIGGSLDDGTMIQQYMDNGGRTNDGS
jgi:hypothetical protein